MRKGGLLLGLCPGDWGLRGAGAEAGARRFREFCWHESESRVNFGLAYSLNCVVKSLGH